MLNSCRLQTWLKLALPVIAVTFVLTAPTTTQASGNLRQELSIVADEIAKFLKARDVDTIALGQFTAPPQLASSGGVGIAHILTEELAKRDITAKPRAALGIEGKFRDVEDAKSQRLAAEVTVQVVDRAGQVLLTLVRGVFGDAALGSLFGMTVETKPADSSAARDQQLRKSLDEPQSNVAATRISAGPNSPYALEILVKNGDKFEARQPQNDAGLVFVPIKRGETYTIRVINDSPHDAAVLLSIDGVNIFAFSENKNYSQFVIPTKQSGVIKGWHRNNEVSDSFLVTEYAKSAAAEVLQSGGNIGTITASFSAAWEKTPPSDEPSNPNAFARSADATGRGPQVEAKYTEVNRQFGVVRATVSVRYTK